jgi:pectate lyase
MGHMVRVLAYGVLCLFSLGEARAANYQGFGASTPGGAQQQIVHVTNLANKGKGSLRRALKTKRTIVFDVGGTIPLSQPLELEGRFVTIDGTSAPSPGITLANHGLALQAHDVIVRGLRIRNAQGDGISVYGGSYNIVIDHVSIQGAHDGSIDVTQGASDVTVQWSILAENDPSHNLLVLVDEQASHVTFHHNLLVKGQSRNPQSSWDSTLATVPGRTVSDIRNNLIWDFLDYGTVIKNNTRANVVQNFYYSATQPSADRALRVTTGGRVYAAGNYSLNGADVDGQGTEAQPFAAVAVDTTDACTAARDVIDQTRAEGGAGAYPLDQIDLQYLSAIDLSSGPCGD